MDQGREGDGGNRGVEPYDGGPGYAEYGPEYEDEDDAWRHSLPQPPRRASERVWKFVRAEYLAGHTAAEVCRRWGLKIATLRARAAAEGWRRADQPPPPDPEPLPLVRGPGAPGPGADAADTDPSADGPDPDTDPGAADYAALARRALARFEQALKRGLAAEAATWLRLHARLRELARTPPAAAAPAPAPAPHADPLDAAMREVDAIAREALRLDPDDADGHAALDARTAAVEARLSALAGAAEIDPIDSIDPVFSDAGVDPAPPPDEPP